MPAALHRGLLLQRCEARVVVCCVFSICRYQLFNSTTSSMRSKTQTDLMPAAFHRRLLLQRGEARVVVRCVVKVEERLAHRAEVARREIRDAVETDLLRLGERSLERTVEEDALPTGLKIAELQLVREAAQHGRIKVVAKIRRADHDPLEVFHLMEDLVILTLYIDGFLCKI